MGTGPIMKDNLWLVILVFLALALGLYYYLASPHTVGEDGEERVVASGLAPGAAATLPSTVTEGVAP
ncbi:MAG: hypothetical protein FJ125_11255, partial [Deltaproteobacteria bacterium]|nr:hypothetical protein [Deltaproteobacteria bacterium]